MIRIATEADIPAMLAVYAPYVEQTTHTFEYDVPSREAFLARFRTITAKYPWLVWEENGVVLGYAYGSTMLERAAYSWCADVSIYLSPEIQGKGVGRRLYHALEQILFYQGYRILYAIITPENFRSRGFHETMGYRVVAELPACGMKFGRWLGIIYMEKRAEMVEIPSKMPERFLSIVNNDRKISEILDILSLS